MVDYIDINLADGMLEGTVILVTTMDNQTHKLILSYPESMLNMANVMYSKLDEDENESDPFPAAVTKLRVGKVLRLVKIPPGDVKIAQPHNLGKQELGIIKQIEIYEAR